MLLMTLQVAVCDDTDPSKNTVVDGVFRATPGMLRKLRQEPRVRFSRSPPPILTLTKDEYTISDA